MAMDDDAPRTNFRSTAWPASPQGKALYSLTYQISPWFRRIYHKKMIYDLSKENDFPGPLLAPTHPASRKPGKH
jgi:hypothetical protein